MKKILFLLVLSVSVIIGCTNNTENKTAKENNLMFFGDTITPENAMAAGQLAAQMKGKDSMKIKLEGLVDAVCQKKGCWMNMNIGNNQTMKIRFKDYAFFVPKDIAGKTAVVEGVAFNDTTKVEELRHYAEDGGKTKEEIEKITEPEINIGFEAKGVIIKK